MEFGDDIQLGYLHQAIGCKINALRGCVTASQRKISLISSLNSHVNWDSLYYLLSISRGIEGFVVKLVSGFIAIEELIAEFKAGFVGP